MSLARLEGVTQNQPLHATGADPRNEATARRVATQFEALLLNQMTASLNPSEDGEGDSLFGSEAGTGLSRQMFSEQLANSMAQSGGIGLSDTLLKQLLPGKNNSIQGGEATRALAAAKTIRDLTAQDFQPGARAVGLAPQAAAINGASGALAASLPDGAYPEPTIISEAPVEGSNSIVPPTDANNSALRGLPDSLRPEGDRTMRPRRMDDTFRVSSTPDAGKSTVASTIRSPRVALSMPVRGTIRSTFGPRRDPINGRHRFHDGIDIAAPRGTPIGAAAAGTVVFASRDRGYGNTVVIEHADGRRTRYAHAERLFVKAGDTVSAGQTIAAVGSTGHSTGPHVHFEITENGRAVNPLSVLANDSMLARR